MAKLFVAENAMSVTERCVQLIGDDGYTRRYPFVRFMRDAKITELYEVQAKFRKWLFRPGWVSNRHIFMIQTKYYAIINKQGMTIVI